MALLTSTRPILDPKIATALGVRAEIQPALNIQALRLYSNITNQLVCDMVQTTKGWLTGLLTVSSAEMSPFLPLNNTLTPRLPEYLAQNGTTVHNTVNAALASALIPYIVNQIMPRGWWISNAKTYVAITGAAGYLSLCERFALHASSDATPDTITPSFTLHRGLLGYRPKLPDSTSTYLEGYGAFVEVTTNAPAATDYLHVQPLFEDLADFPIASIPIAHTAALLSAIT